MDLPIVTVIMPIRNEADFIASSLGSVLQQDYPSDRLEILLADGMSIDDTRQIVTQLTNQYTHIPIHIIDNPKQTVPTGLNLALKEAKGEIIVRVDGHCEIAPDYILKCVHYLKRCNIVGVGGAIETISLDEGIGKTIANVMSSKFGVGGAAFRTLKNQHKYVDTVAFPGYWRWALDEAGPFDEELMRNQDDEYNYRLRSLGYKILLASDVKAKYYSRSSLQKLRKQYFQYGVYKVRVLQKHPLQMSFRQFVPPLFVFSAICGSVFSFINWIRRLWLFMIAMYMVLNLAASWQLYRREKITHSNWLPLVFATIHVSYGLGFLYGLFKFRHRWMTRD